MHGFKLVSEQTVSELGGSIAKLWLHEKSGAQLLSFCNQDSNKVFGVSLRTPPHDSTGLPHILEHSVLCGSAKYPVKEPFVELLKGSLQTFLNAFTYPDKTCYPVASANLKDFYNLIDVYLDAVFHPNITKEIFLQEGWHLDAELPEGKAKSEPQITFKGVVYNEMKGVFSSPEAVLERQSMHALFPDTPYGLESGGDPAAIPSLTFEDFINFHRRYYHPSNARFYFWGDDPEDKRLEILDGLLKNYTAISITDSVVPLQKSFTEPSSLRLPFVAGDEDKAMLVTNWVLPPVGHDPETVELILALEILDHILLGMPASPLRRALIESGLGEDLTGSGVQNELKQMLFSIGLKGIEEKNASKVEQLILNTLQHLVNEGIPSDSIEAAINSVEFALRENNTGRFPVGLAIMLRSLTTWLHADQPEEAALAALAPLRFETPLATIKAKSNQPANPQNGYFEQIIKKHLLENQHRATLLLYPDQNLGNEMAAEEEARLLKHTGNLDAKAKLKLVEHTNELKRIQETPDAPEALAAIPRLSVSDLPPSNQEIPQTKLDERPAPVYFNPQPTNGICYLGINLDINSVPNQLLPLLPMLGRAMLEMGNKQRDFIELNMSIARKTGGMDADLLLLTRLQDRLPIGSMCISGKAAPDKVHDLFQLSLELMSKTELDNQEHFMRMLLEEKARLEYSLVPSGHMVVSSRLRAGLSLTGWLSEQSSGICYLNAIRELCSQAEHDWPALLKKLAELRQILLNRNNIIMNITAEEGQAENLLQEAKMLLDALPDSANPSPVARVIDRLPEQEALVTQAQVNYVGKGINLFNRGYAYHGSAMVILKYLRTGYLWEKVRVQGGAYGAFCTLDRASGDLVLASYRDPNIENTIRVFSECGKYLLNNTPGKRELDTAIVGAIGEIDSYMLPEAKGNTAFIRTLTGNTPELRARLRDEVLGASAKDFKLFGEYLDTFIPDANTVALGGQALEEIAKKNAWTINKVL